LAGDKQVPLTDGHTASEIATYTIIPDQNGILAAKIDLIKAAGMISIGSRGLNTIMKSKDIQKKNFRIWLNIFQKTTLAISTHPILNTTNIMALIAGKP